MPKYYTLLVYFLFLPFILFGKDKNTAERPKIGLVLSGGGAKGLAHIGILKAMENAGIRPDYITGTSMGSLVGGLYAIGYSADEIETIVSGVDWEKVLSNKIPFRNVVVEEKPYYNRFMIDLVFDGKKLSLPAGVLQSQQINQLLSTLTRGVHNIESFDDFPIPFRCVASDIVKGEKVVLDSGNLALSMRASMAIPSIFTPIEMGDRILVDGGLIRNFPVDEVLEMGADYVIGVLVAQDLLDRKNLKSATGILYQSAWMNGVYDTREQTKKCDILITPDLMAFSAASFSKTPEILEIGKEYGALYEDQFQALADSLAKFPEQNTLKKPLLKDEYKITELDLGPNLNRNQDLLESTIKMKKSNEWSINEINNELTRLYGTLKFSNLNFEIEDTEKKDGDAIKIIGQESPPGRLSFSPNYSSEYRTGLVFNFAIYDFLAPSSRWLGELNLSENPYIHLNFLKNIGKSNRFALYADINAIQNPLPRYNEKGNKTALMTEAIFQPRVGLRTTGTFRHTFGLDFGAKLANQSPTIADEALRIVNTLSYTNMEYRFTYSYNSINRRYYPTSGAWVNFNTIVGEGVERIKFDNEAVSDIVEEQVNLSEFVTLSEIAVSTFGFDQYVQFNDNLSLQIGGNLGFSYNTNQNLLNSLYVGGFYPREENSIPFWGLSLREIPVENLGIARLGIQYGFQNKLFLKLMANYGKMKLVDSFLVSDLNPQPDPFILEPNSQEFEAFGVGGEIGYLTPFGPISFQSGKVIGNRRITSNIIIGFWL
ncbi:patatin-like phospholipase family protein [Persicobacter diffluens]|uniref:Patatin n=1 Tax=Persicobacter diffluens TaxID=981 RepID=A0AAN4VVZ2_9BACT|nr:patatin [Persicobacter diffluens]